MKALAPALLILLLFALSAIATADSDQDEILTQHLKFNKATYLKLAHEFFRLYQSTKYNFVMYNFENDKLCIGESPDFHLGEEQYIMYYTFEHNEEKMRKILQKAERFSVFSRFEIDLKQLFLQKEINQARIIQHYVLKDSSDEKKASSQQGQSQPEKSASDQSKGKRQDSNEQSNAMTALVDYIFSQMSKTQFLKSKKILEILFQDMRQSVLQDDEHFWGLFQQLQRQIKLEEQSNSQRIQRQKEIAKKKQDKENHQKAIKQKQAQLQRMRLELNKMKDNAGHEEDEDLDIKEL